MAEAFHSPCALLAPGHRRLQPRSTQSRRGFFLGFIDRTACSTIPLRLEKGRGDWAAAENLGPLLTGCHDGDRKALKQRQRDDASNSGKHGYDELGSSVRCPFAVNGWQLFGGLNTALLSFTAINGLSFRCANGMGPHKNALLVQAESTTLIW